MATALFASVCRLLQPVHYKFQAKGALPANRNFVAEMRKALFVCVAGDAACETP